MWMRSTIFIILCSAIWTGESVLDHRVEPGVSTQLSIRALNGTNEDQANLLNSKTAFDWIPIASAGLSLLAAAVCFSPYVSRALSPKGK